MSLDNKAGGDKYFAFESNAIMKAIRDLFSMFLDKWGFIGSQTITGGNFTTPNNCNFVIIKVTAQFSSFYLIGDVMLTRVGKTTGSFVTSATGSTSNVAGYDFSWSSNTITMAANGAPAGVSATAYFYS